MPNQADMPMPTRAERDLTYKRIVFLLLGVGIFAADQLSKQPFRCCWKQFDSVEIFPWLHFTFVHNTGSLFGLFQGNPVPLGIISMVVSAVIIGYAFRLERRSGWLPYITLGILLGGAAGNGYDRLVHRYVVDFLDLHWNGRNVWPVFNVADIAVDVAIVLFVLMAFHEPKAQLRELDARRAEGGQDQEPAAAEPYNSEETGS